MKKVLFVVVCYVLCVSFDVHAKEYKLGETKECSYDSTLKCDLNENLITGILKRYVGSKVDAESYYENGKRNGFARTYYDNGQLEREITFKDGKQDGIAKAYYENGTLAAESFFKDAKLDGIIKFYYENGNLEGIYTFRDGKREGITKKYYESGTLAAEAFLKDDKLDGIAKLYYENGKLKTEVTLSNGIQVGVPKEYDESGNEVSFQIIQDMVDLMKKNPARANKAYLEKTIYFLAPIEHIDSDADYFSIDTGEHLSVRIGCYIRNASHKQIITDKNVGEWVFVKGKVRHVGDILGYSIDVIELR